jgi:mRNA interferase RelE/StbE
LKSTWQTFKLNAYKLRFHEKAWAEWQKLDASPREAFKKKLIERLTNPRIPSAALSGMSDCYKIKLQALGLRLVYRVDDDVIFVTVIALGQRDKKRVYTTAQARL